MGRPSSYDPAYCERVHRAKSNVRNMTGKRKGRRYAKLGVDEEAYEFMCRFQRNRCGICERHRDEFTKDFAVDHCHETGRVRGLLCANCNTALGLLKDSRNSIARAARWIMTEEELGLN